MISCEGRGTGTGDGRGEAAKGEQTMITVEERPVKRQMRNKMRRRSSDENIGSRKKETRATAIRVKR